MRSEYFNLLYRQQNTLFTSLIDSYFRYAIIDLINFAAPSKVESSKYMSTPVFLQKLSVKLILFAISIGVIPILLLSYVFIFELEKNVLNETQNELELLADAQEGAVLIFLDDLKNQVINFSTDRFIQSSVGSTVNEDGGTALNEYLAKKLATSDDLVGINILNLEGTIIASTDQEEIGSQEPDEVDWKEALELKKNEATVSDITELYEFGSKDPLFTVLSPVFNESDTEITGIIIGYYSTLTLDKVLIGEYQLKLGASTGLKSKRDSLDIYLVNSNRQMISASRFLGREVFLKRAVNTVPVKGCLDNNEELTGLWGDYRNPPVPVIGSSMCFHQHHDWTLLVEIDESEIMQPVLTLERNIVIGVVILLALTILFGLLFSFGISRPISKLTKVADDISRGKLDSFIDPKALESKGEIGDLANAFNRTVVSLKLAMDEGKDASTPSSEEKEEKKDD